MKIEIYSDGSGTKEKPGGYGWVIVINDKEFSHGSGRLEVATNNDAELEASIQGLASLLKLVTNGEIKVEEDSTITLVSDSQIILNWASGNYRFKQEAKVDRYNKLIWLMNRFKAKTRWVRGHSGEEFNEMCDKLANQARKGAEENVPKKRTNVLKKSTSMFLVEYKGVVKVVDLEKNIVYNCIVHEVGE